MTTTATPAADTGLPKTTRRGLLMAAPASVLATALPAMAEGGDSPIAKLFDQWVDLRELSAEGSDYDEAERILGQAAVIAKTIMAAETITARDLVSKIVVDTVWGEFHLNEQHFAEMVTFAGLDERWRRIRVAEDACAARIKEQRAAAPQPGPKVQPEPAPKTSAEVMADAIVNHALCESVFSARSAGEALADQHLATLLAIQPQSDEERGMRDAYFARLAKRFAVIAAAAFPAVGTHYADVLRMKAEVEATAGLSDDEMTQALGRVHDAEQLVLDADPVTAADLAKQVAVLIGEDADTPDLGGTRAGTAGVIRTRIRALSGLPAFPVATLSEI